MKTYALFIIFVSAFLWSSSVQSQSALGLLKNKNTRQEIFTAIITDSALFGEFMDTMKKNPESCKRMMNDKGMKMMGDSSMMQNMMGGNKSMKDKMKEEDNMDMAGDSIVYTCPMHPEIKSPKPGKCPKCGMDLVKKPQNRNAHTDKMKMP